MRVRRGASEAASTAAAMKRAFMATDDIVVYIRFVT